MKWPTCQLKKVASSATAKIKLNPNDEVWHLNLDQIESHTGNILEKKIAPVSSAGNSTYIFDNKNVLYSKLRPYLNKVVCPEELGIATTELVPLCPHPKLLDRNFLTYFLRSNSFLNFASAMVTGAKMPRVIMAKFWDYEIPLPPLSEQRRIVEILDQADLLRKLRAEADKKAERILPALFIKMFGDPATNPMGWETFDLGSKKKLDIKGGGTPSKENQTFWNGTIPWVSPKDMKVEVIEDTLDHVTEEAIRRSSTNRVSANSILLVVRSGILAHTVPIALASREMALNQDMKSFTVKDETELNPLFLFGWMKAATNSLIRGCIKFGATVHSLDMTRLGRIKVINPPVDDQNKFALQFKETLTLQSNRMKSEEIIGQLFNSILHRAFTGDLTASWRQAHMKELLQEMELQAKALAS